ncbi:hypothetical protein [Pseudomonas sp. NBRC 100443]|uniref:lipase family protein n=1 Tax=Pseudomonas sp. NBRC 100443 TaxID=1113665 RepID=UPI0025549BF0|nr:hypothetical protein [Pseudomonas sp. NBRC 100443]
MPTRSLKGNLLRIWGGRVGAAARRRDLFICGHSLGGALGLIHAASLKDLNPLLYTYGMPRTFTLQAVACLDDMWHFRHVNDTDLIPEVPPEADLENSLYKLYGPLGTTLGTTWSVAQLMADLVIRGKDPFYHHGEIVAFYRTEQHMRIRGSENQFYKMREGPGAPYHTVISRPLPAQAKLFLVPALSKEDDEKARAAQERYTASLSPDHKDKYFPKGRNVKRGNLLGIRNHFMGKYQPYIYGQLVESINPSRMQERQNDRRKLNDQMVKYAELIPEDELVRDRLFLELQSLKVFHRTVLPWLVRAIRQHTHQAQVVGRDQAVVTLVVQYQRPGPKRAHLQHVATIQALIGLAITHLASEGVSTEAAVGEVVGRQWFPLWQRRIESGKPVAQLADAYVVIIVPRRDCLLLDGGIPRALGAVQWCGITDGGPLGFGTLCPQSAGL